MLKTMLLAAPLVLGSAAHAQLSTAFTYQGRLKDNGQNANGLYDLEFKLFTTATGGIQLGPTSCVNNVLVADGLFTAILDFGQQYAAPGQRFIEVAVRADGGLDCSNEAGFFVLTPRSPLPSVPLAAHANSAFALDVPNGSHPGAVTVDNSGRVGVGTAAPQATLHLVTPGEGVRIQGPAAGAANTAWMGFFDAFGTRTGYVGDASSQDSAMYLAADSGDVRLSPLSAALVTAKPDGKVGIGTTSPSTKLDVRGDIRLGPSGEFHVLAHSEPLRVIYGVIDFDGFVLSGPGLAVTHPSTGRYNITFSTPFSGVPTVTATVNNTPGANTAFNMISNVTSSSLNLEVFQRDGGPFYNQGFQFIAVGPR
jgi:hypothetical protein